MSKIKKLTILSVGSVLSVPFTTALGILTLSVGRVGAWVAAFVGIAVLIGVAFAVERMRKRLFSEVHIAIFTLCAYLPGLVAAITICAVMLNLPRSPEDIEGWGALARGFMVLFATAAQGVLTLAGIAVELNANGGKQK